MKKKQTTSYFDYTLVVIIVFLLAFGLVMLYSASSYSAQLNGQKSTFYLNKQIVNDIVGIVALLFAVSIDYHKWYKLGALWYLLAIVAVLSVLTPFGVSKYGATRWVAIGPLSLQPSEIAKVAVIVFMAILICKLGKNVGNPKALTLMIVFPAIISGLVLVFNDNLSTAIIILGISLVMIFVAHPKYRPFVIMAVLVLVAGFAIIKYAASIDISDTAGKSFRLKRIVVWLDPEKDASDKGYQVLQGLYAIGSGGIFGKGLGNSIQKLGFIPEAQNDMIFAIICEELGLFGAICVILVFVVMIWRLMIIASNAPDLFGSLITVGVMAHIAIQVILNIAVVTNTIPNTGVTLPFISYGGTSIMFLMFELGLVLNVSKQIVIKK